VSFSTALRPLLQCEYVCYSNFYFHHVLLPDFLSGSELTGACWGPLVKSGYSSFSPARRDFMSPCSKERTTKKLLQTRVESIATAHLPRSHECADCCFNDNADETAPRSIHYFLTVNSPSYCLCSYTPLNAA
jgi:hypothetical protein